MALYCHSLRREKKEQAIVDRFSSRFEQALEHLEQGLGQPRRMKQADKVQQKIGRLRQQYSRVSGQY
ncbi:MAG TPA: transposase, partial [Gammaproteobacteria bacterium]|nr:transposase [Gammaproteobacteria bacterium]